MPPLAITRPKMLPSPLGDGVGHSNHDRFRGYLSVHLRSGLQFPCLRFSLLSSRWLHHRVVTAIRLILIATVLVCIGDTRAIHAQEIASTPSWGDVGGSFAPWFKAYLDVESCCNPPGGWVTWGTGKFRLQMDYVHNRRRYLTYSGYYEEREGQEIVVQRAYLDTHVEQVANALVYWRLSEN